VPAIQTHLAANRAAVDELLAAAERAKAAWNAPCAPGKWSPSQIVEHVARVLEESAKVVVGAPSAFPSLPRFLRPLVRGLYFSRTLKKNAFPKSKTPQAFHPPTGPADPARARARLEAALGDFERACTTQAARSDSVTSSVFGTVSLEDYARFQELHTRHHARQLPGAPGAP